MKKPLIGIAADRAVSATHAFKVEIPEKYAESVIRAEGIPLLIPLGLSQDDLEELSLSLDGILLAGGGDIDPAVFNGAPHPAIYGIKPERDRQEIALVHLALRTHIPLLGICRGVQVMNVAMQGGLYTHILIQLTGALQHSTPKNLPREHIQHKVMIEGGSRLSQIIQETNIPVNSHHHQGLDKAASGLNVSAYAPDGLIEAVELPGPAFFVGVQWHPEWLQEHGHANALFSAFCQAAVQYHHNRDANG
jgi:putative glutamine amidotransferase